MQFDVSPLKPLSGQDRLKIPLLCHQNSLWNADSRNLCRNGAENFPSKPSQAFPDEHASLPKPWHNAAKLLDFIQSKLKVIFNKKIDANIFFASSSKETNYFSSQRNRSVISFKMTLKFNSVEVFKGKVGVTLITEFWIDLNSDLSFSCEISNIQFRWGFQRQSIIFRFRIFQYIIQF